MTSVGKKSIPSCNHILNAWLDHDQIMDAELNPK